MQSAFAPMSHETYPHLAAEPLVYEHHGAQGLEGRLRILPHNHTPALRTGLDLLPERPLVVLGFSPGNAYFTRKRIEIAVCAMAHLFGEVAVVVPDTIAVHTYRALGYDEKQSHAKARENGLNLKNRCRRAIERVRAESPTANVHLLDWDRDIASLPGYTGAYERVRTLFDSNERFRIDVLDKGYSVLGAKLGREAVTYDAARESVEYLLKEFAYFTLFRSTFGRDVVVPYHQDFTLGQRFCDGGYTEPLPGIGWLVYDIDVAGDERSEKGVGDARCA